MGFKCTPQVMGLVRGEPKVGQKHRAPLSKIAIEAGYERASKSATLDRARSDLNRYEGYRSGAEFAADMEAEAAAYRVKVKGKTKDGHEIIRVKGLPHNAVVGFAVIHNPPAEVCAAWSDEQYEKFYKDSREVMAIIEPRIFRQANIRMSAEHFDEGLPLANGSIDRHLHDLGVCKDYGGRYCGNLIDAKLLIKINEKYPAMMRKRGWDIDDLDTTDFERAKTDKEYAAERNERRRKSGLSVNSYLKRKAQETAQETAEMKAEAVEMVNQATEKQQRVERILADRKRQIEKSDQELQEKKNKLDKRDKSQRRFVRFIRDLIEELGGVRRKFATYGEAMSALREAKDSFISRTKRQAEEAAAAKYRDKEVALNDRETVLDELSALRDTMQIYADADTSRKRFMATHRAKSGRTLEEIYQASLRDFQARKEAFLRRGDEMAAEYYSLREQLEELQR